jgi:hypothetical protein
MKVRKKPGRPAVRPARNVLVWAIPLMAAVVFVGFLAGERVGAGESGAGESGAAAAPAGAAVDLSSLSPEEGASHLYDRVMRYGETGSLDSARFYAPLALKAYEALGAPDAHTRYDVGMIWAVVGDSLKARSEAENILNERPLHLLGLLLAMRTAATPALRSTYERRFVAAAKSELPNPLPEYDEHRHDIDGALRAAEAARK